MTERKKRKTSSPKNALRAAKERGASRQSNRKRRVQLFQSKGGPGALPDFVIIGAQKGGTTSLYNLLKQHPLVERGALKEIHYFDDNFDRGIEWYRSLFPPPKLKDGHKTITGEATPGYLSHPSAPERMAQAVPQAKLIVLLRNPVDRAYSAYHHAARNGRESRSFQETVEAEQRWLSGEGGEGAPEHPEQEQHPGGVIRPLLSRGIYVDQLKRWSEHFDQEQMLVLKSEDFFGRTPETLKVVLNFLGLPEWEPEAWEVRNQGSYKEMDPGVRSRLEAYFEGHNQRLYDYLGKDLGW